MGLPVDELDAADLDDPVPRLGLEARRLRIENDLAHRRGVSLSGLIGGAILPQVASKSTLAARVRERLIEAEIRERIGALVLRMARVAATQCHSTS